MNTNELKSLLKQAGDGPLEKLARADAERLADTLRKLLVKLEKIAAAEALGRIEVSIPQEDKKLFAQILKSHGGKKANLRAHEAAAEECRKRSRQYRAFLKEIRALKADEAVGRVGKLNADEKQMLALLANVTKNDGKLLKPGATPKSIREWLAGLALTRSGLFS